MNANLNQERFWPYYENEPIKMIPTIPHNPLVSFLFASLYYTCTSRPYGPSAARSRVKGCCDLCLAFDCKGHIASHSWGAISYLHAKFELNRPINSRDTI